MPGVRDVAVFGIPDEEYGEALAAHVDVDPAAELREEDVRAYVRVRLASYKTPRSSSSTTSCRARTPASSSSGSSSSGTAQRRARKLATRVAPAGPSAGRTSEDHEHPVSRIWGFEL
ncbi:MAG: AMP-binding enzyme [Pseudonocardiaceae bacterium]